MINPRAATYYLRSCLTLLTGFAGPLGTVRRFLPGVSMRAGEVRLRESGWRFRVRSAMDMWIIKETCLDREYLWATSLEPDWTVVDIGAGLGDFTVLAAKLCPQGTIHAYEPLASSFALLQHNLDLNDIDHATAFPQGVAAQSGYVAAESGAAAPTSTRFAAAAPGAAVAVDLGTVLERLPRGRCDFMKIDCEGCEFELLMSASPETLARIGRLSIETHEGYTGHSAAELAAWLERHAFLVRRRPNPVHSYLGLLYAERRGDEVEN